MLTYTLDKSRGESLYASLYEHIREDIAGGKLKAGERLPSKRALAENLGVSVATVESAYAQLMAEGYVESRERSGYYVCAVGFPQSRRREALPVPETPEKKKKPLFDLSSGGGKDVSFPFSVWAKTMRGVVAEKGKEIMHPTDFRGVPELRKAIADYLYQSRNIQVSEENMIIGAGNEYLYGLLVQLLGRNRRYGVEDPGYPQISRIYRANDVKILKIPLDREGLSAEALMKSGTEILHISPAHHFPTGIVMPVSRRNAILDWAYEKPERYIIEDDYDSELRHTGKPVPPLFSLDTQGRVLYLSTFSQTISPSLRIAYICLPRQLMERFRKKLGFYNCAVPCFEQYTLARFIASGDYERHINRLRKRLRDNREVILGQIENGPLQGRCSIQEERAGTHFLLKLKTGKGDRDLKREAAAHGLGTRFLSDYQEEPSENGCLVLNYACMEAEKLPHALEILAEII